jgi:hypothetical protein
MNFPPQFPSDYCASQFHVFAEWDWSSQRIALRLIHFAGMGGKIVTVAEPIKMVPREEAEYRPPTLELNSATAQSLMDALWQCGCRPTEGTGSAGSLAATQRHLEDMRALVFQHVDVTKLPKTK